AVTLEGLDELTSAPMGSGVDWSKLEPLYSKVTLTGTFALNVGAGGVRAIRAVAGITMGDLSARGGNASGATAGGAGPGGCAGGAGLVVGACDGGGHTGGNTTNNGGGGGAGFADTGGNGGGSVPGIGGPTEGDDMVSSYVDTGTLKANHAAGGGGGVVILGTA